VSTRLLPRSSSAQLAALVVAFAAGTLVARPFGAGWGTASAFGQMAFVVVLVAILLAAERRPARGSRSG